MIECEYKGDVISLSDGATPFELVKQIDSGLTKKVIAVEIDGQIWDMNRKIPDGTHSIDLIYVDSDKGLDVMRHSCAHVMAEAVKKLYPGTKLGVGPTIEDGFYYDMLIPETVSDSDLPRIEKVMKRIISGNYMFERLEMSRKEAKELVKKMNEDFKDEIITQIDEADKISFYRDGDFIDLCRGPHIPSTSWIKAFKLLKVSGAYWRGDEKNVMLTRIYGTAFDTKERLQEYLDRIEKAKEVDHRRLGTALDLFSTQDEVGPGLVLWHPNGAMIKYIVERFWYDLHLKRDYNIVSTPHISSEDLFRKSGHLEAFSKDMYGAMEIDGRFYRVKPMNCPFHIMIYKSATRSYRELPLRFAEMGQVYRYEKSGVLHGLMRVRSFTIDDAHIFVRKDQIEEEVMRVYSLMEELMKKFGFKDFEPCLSTRPEEYIGSLEGWDYATGALESVLKKNGAKYEIEEGGGAFYGPKISFNIRDSLGRYWQCGTVQLDFNLPERFDLSYMSKGNKFERPVMIHRALFGSLERFIGVLIEHYGGKFPFWLSPVQVKVLTLNRDVIDYGEAVIKYLKENGIRAKLDRTDERIGNKIRIASQEKIPVIAVVGVKEKQDKTVSIRLRGSKDQLSINQSELISYLNSISVEVFKGN